MIKSQNRSCFREEYWMMDEAVGWFRRLLVAVVGYSSENDGGQVTEGRWFEYASVLRFFFFAGNCEMLGPTTPGQHLSCLLIPSRTLPYVRHVDK